MQTGLTSLETLNRKGREGTTGKNEPSDFISVQKMETEKQLCIHYERLNFFFTLWIISDVESVNILKLNSFSV